MARFYNGKTVFKARIIDIFGNASRLSGVKELYIDNSPPIVTGFYSTFGDLITDIEVGFSSCSDELSGVTDYWAVIINTLEGDTLFNTSIYIKDKTKKFSIPNETNDKLLVKSIFSDVSGNETVIERYIQKSNSVLSDQQSISGF
ncbi:hypothetical protein H8D85_00935 [bacterium]|nr:hypothetical protein [bacterium]